MIFYVPVIAVLFFVATAGRSSGAPQMVMGYSCFTVLSSSMQNEIPKGSLIVVKQTDPSELNVGDNITYMRDQYTSVTHQITEVYENYESSGARGFQTKGVNNVNPDSDIVYEADVVGKVVLVIPSLGMSLSYFEANSYLLFVFLLLCMFLSFLLKGIFTRHEMKTA